MSEIFSLFIFFSKLKLLKLSKNNEKKERNWILSKTNITHWHKNNKKLWKKNRWSEFSNKRKIWLWLRGFFFKFKWNSNRTHKTIEIM